MTQKIKKAIKNSFIVKIIPDDVYVKIVFRLKMGYKLNLKNPKTFNEKLQWLKLYDRKPIYTDYVDKYKVRNIVENLIGNKYLIPLLGVWNSFEEIDFNKLPNQFVLKCNHDSGGLVICKEKSNFDIKAAKKKINSSLKTNYYYHSREWHYKNVKPLIIAEKYIEDYSGALIDYKFFCFNGKSDFVMICVDRFTDKKKFYFFDENWKRLKFTKSDFEDSEQIHIPKPKNLNKMFEIASVLSNDMKFARIDLYECDEKIYFGEITIIPDSGFDNTFNKDTDLFLGSKILL